MCGKLSHNYYLALPKQPSGGTWSHDLFDGRLAVITNGFVGIYLTCFLRHPGSNSYVYTSVWYIDAQLPRRTDALFPCLGTPASVPVSILEPSLMQIPDILPEGPFLPSYLSYQPFSIAMSLYRSKCFISDGPRPMFRDDGCNSLC